MSDYYSEREICEIVWLVASEHVYNVTNIGLNIHSDMLCNLIETPRMPVRGHCRSRGRPIVAIRPGRG
jgi:hypothetical protein